jgi:hypothetical protein
MKRKVEINVTQEDVHKNLDLKYIIEAAKIEAAKNEIRLLRQNATPEELQKLDFEQLSPTHPKRCIYGQMTGSCYSERAAALLNICATPFTKHGVSYTSRYRVSRGRETGENPFDVKAMGNIRLYYSTLENLIAPCYPGINENIIAYLKGETDEFTF